MTKPSSNGAAALESVPAGQTVRLVSVQAGHGLRQRLAALGLLANVRLKVLRNEGCGQIIVEVKGTRVALGRGMARRIFVKSQPAATGRTETNATERGASGDGVDPPPCSHEAHDRTA